MASNEQLWTEIHQLRHDCHQLQQERHHLLNESNRLIEENLRLKETISRLVTENQEVRGKCAELREKNNKLLALQQRVAQAEQVSREPNRAPAAPTVGINVIPDEYEEAMVAALNKWWEDEKPERRGLLNLLAQLGVPAEFYTMKAIEAVMQGVSWNGPYSLQPSEKDGGWLFCKSGPLEAIMLPADAVFFDTEPMRKILQRIMIGCENLNSKPQFDEAFNACRLTLEGDKQGSYRVTGKGVVRIANHPKPSNYGNPFRSFDELATGRKSREVAGGRTAKEPIESAGDARTIEAIRALLQEMLVPIQKDVAGVTQQLERIGRELQNDGRADGAAWGNAPPAEAVAAVVKYTPVSSDYLKKAYAQVSLSDSSYLKRLKSLRHALNSESPELTFEISHLLLQSSKFAKHSVRSAGGDPLYCETCKCEPREQQCFLTASANEKGSLWVLLPPGNFDKFDYINGYSELLDLAQVAGTSGKFAIATACEPALLQLNDKEGLLRVLRKMSVA